MEDETPVIAVVLASPTSEAEKMAVDDLPVESEVEQDPRPDPEQDVEPTPVIVEIPRQDPELNVDLPRPDPAVEHQLQGRKPAASEISGGYVPEMGSALLGAQAQAAGPSASATSGAGAERASTASPACVSDLVARQVPSLQPWPDPAFW